MSRNRKIAVSVGVLALLLGVGINMQVSAFNPKSSEVNVKVQGDSDNHITEKKVSQVSQ